MDARTYATRFTACNWGCRMPVEMIIDQWKPDVKGYRFETTVTGRSRAGSIGQAGSVSCRVAQECLG